MGLIAMSERDLQRIEVLSTVIAGRMTLVSAAHVLDLSERQVRRLLGRIRTTGAASIRHKAIGRPSNHRISDGVRDQKTRDQRLSVVQVLQAYDQAGPDGLVSKKRSRPSNRRHNDDFRNAALESDPRRLSGFRSDTGA
ncbi:hypothetical protein ATY29_27170 [Rhizobium hidalgonense]|nr:hypothetical protein ATY29_27170 [Rhizobium hidalgonense]